MMRSPSHAGLGRFTSMPLLTIRSLTLSCGHHRYVRIKRKNQTIFLHVESTDSFGQLKKQVGEILEVDPNNVLFYAGDKVRC